MTLPEGLTYVPGFLTETEERDVLAVPAGFGASDVLHDTVAAAGTNRCGHRGRRRIRRRSRHADPGRRSRFGSDAPRRDREPGEHPLVTRTGRRGDRLARAPQFGDVSGIPMLTACRSGFAAAAGGNGRAHPRAPLRICPVRSGADTMAARHPSRHRGAVVDNVPHLGRSQRLGAGPGATTSVPRPASPRSDRGAGGAWEGRRSARRTEGVVVDAQLHRGQVEQRGLDPVAGATAGQVGQDLLDLGRTPLGDVA